MTSMTRKDGRAAVHRRVLLAPRIQIARRSRTIELGTRGRRAQGDRGTKVIPTERGGDGPTKKRRRGGDETRLRWTSGMGGDRSSGMGGDCSNAARKDAREGGIEKSDVRSK